MGQNPDVAKAKVLLDLSNQAQSSFHDRRQIEWKVNFGVWTILAAAIALTYTEQIETCLFFVALPAAFLCGAHLYWLCAMHARNTINKTVQHFYASEANKLLGVYKKFERKTPAKPLPNSKLKKSPREVIDKYKDHLGERWSVWASVIVTTVLAVVLVFSASIYAHKSNGGNKSELGKVTQVRLV